MNRNLKSAGLAILICSSAALVGSHKACANEQEAMREKVYSNNKEYQDSINIETQLKEFFGIFLYPEKKFLLDSTEASQEHERLRKKMLAD